MTLPDFIIIGAAKSGTSSLFKYFERDDRFFLSSPKEPEFFARDEHYAKGLEWYSKLFIEAGSEQLCCEASTLYSLSPLFENTAGRIRESIPNVKLIYIMRDPVDRAYSYYVQLVKNYQNSHRSNNIPKSFEAFLFDTGPEVGNKNSKNLALFDDHLTYCPELLTAGGMYLEQINRYMRYFDRSAFHFMVFEEFISNPLKELSKLYEFLGINSDSLDGEFEEIYENISNSHFQTKAYHSAIKTLKRSRVLRAIARLAPEFVNRYAKKTIHGFQGNTNAAERIKPKPMKDSTRAYLEELYLDPNKQLSDFLSRDIRETWG